MLEELRILDVEAAEFHESALWVLAEPANPKRARLAAGAMRELTAELAKDPGVVHTRTLKARVFELRDQWRKIRLGADGSIESRSRLKQLRDDYSVRQEADRLRVG